MLNKLKLLSIFIFLNAIGSAQDAGTSNSNSRELDSSGMANELSKCVEKRDIERLRALYPLAVKKGFDPRYKGYPEGNTLFHIAVKECNKEALAFLGLAYSGQFKNVDFLEIKNLAGNNIFEMAVYIGKMDIINFFTTSAGNLDEGLDAAVHKPDLPLVKYFINRGAPFSKALIFDLKWGRKDINPEILEFLDKLRNVSISNLESLFFGKEDRETALGYLMFKFLRGGGEYEEYLKEVLRCILTPEVIKIVGKVKSLEIIKERYQGLENYLYESKECQDFLNSTIEAIYKEITTS